MAIAFRNSSGASGAGGGNYNVAKPTGVVSGDFLLWIFTTQAATLPAAPSGWAQAQASTLKTGSTLVDNVGFWYKVAGSSEPANYSAPSGASISTSEIYAVFSNSGGTLAFDTSALATPSTSGNGALTDPSVTTSQANDAVVYLGAVDGSTTPTAPSGTSSLAFNDNGANDACVFAAFKIVASAGASGTGAWGGLGLLDTCGCTVAIKETAAGGTSWNQALAEAHSATDASARTPRKALADATSALDALTKLCASLRADATSATDTGSHSATKRVSGDAHSATDAVSRFRSFLQTLLDAQSGRDTLGGRGVAKSLSDATSAVDALAKLYAVLRTDAFSLVDALSKIPAKTFLERISETDGLSAFKPSGSSWNVSLTDKHSALDVVAKQITRLTADQISALDTFSRTWVARLVLLDLFSETDAQSKQLARALQDTQVAQDLVQKLVARSIQEAHSATDARTSLVLHALAEALSATDRQTRAYSKGLFDALSQTDRLTAGRLLLLALLDSFSLLDSAGQPQLAHPLAAQKIGMVASLVASLVGIRVSLQIGAGVSLALSLVPSPVGAVPSLLPPLVSMQTLLVPVPVGLTATLL